MGKIAGLKQAAENGDMYAQAIKAPETNPLKLLKDPPVKIEKGTLAFTLKDEDGNPMADVKYEVTLPGGGVKKGVTGKDGKVNLSGIDPGTCKVSFPDLDADEWN